MRAIQGIFLSLLFFMMAINSCSAQQQLPVKQVKVNGQVHDVPYQFQAFTGDEITIEAIVNPPYQLLELRINNNPVNNPYTFTVIQPTVINIDVTTTLNFQLSLANSEYINDFTFEFDVIIRSFTETFKLTAYQVALTYNSLWRDDKALNLEYIQGTSELTNPPTLAVKWDSTTKRFSFASMAGEDVISSVEKRIGRFKVSIPESFLFGVNVDLKFYFQESGGMGTILTGENFADITEYGNYLSLPEQHRITLKVE